ncbi:NUDIX hydrolase [Caballeronia temeraria]|uniref:NUDIX hydrolase n=2 Tax=Caballeronia TaxID=1827195 RepID=A0A158CSG1_9BURK|nr:MULTISPECIES: NUDIX domain-containing protein [Caballeronia]SAK75275.1 NUDIX hydrolase [Caballeronia temeraria]SAK84836.1 NUDIX hydrolase [Caballeronia fortuita]
MKRRATVICERDGKVLLVAREQGRWAFPGGRQKRGEDIGETARRELREETGLDPKGICYAFQFRGLRTRHYVFLALVGRLDEAIPSNEIVRCCWMLPTDLLRAAASIPTKGIAAILLRQTRSGQRHEVAEDIDTGTA